MIVGNQTIPDPKFAKEADLCRAFAGCVPSGWTLYNETGGFDILAVHDDTGNQIGIEAKLTLNAKVLLQAVNGRQNGLPGPDFRAVLVGKVVAENAELARHLSINVLTMKPIADFGKMLPYFRQGPYQLKYKIAQDLPSFNHTSYDPKAWYSGYYRDEWFDQAPTQRLKLPEYVPDVEAGHPAPQSLSEWKIRAIKVCIQVETAGEINRADFKALKIDPSRWMNGYWLDKAGSRGQWKAGRDFPAAMYRKQHPKIYAQIKADYPTWSAAAKLPGPKEKLL